MSRCHGDLLNGKMSGILLSQWICDYDNYDFSLGIREEQRSLPNIISETQISSKQHQRYKLGPYLAITQLRRVAVTPSITGIGSTLYTICQYIFVLCPSSKTLHGAVGNRLHALNNATGSPR